MLCLSTLLAPAGFAQALSYSQQFFEIMSDFPARFHTAATGWRGLATAHVADTLVGSLATQSLVPCDVLADTTTATAECEKKRADKHGIQPMHTG